MKAWFLVVRVSILCILMTSGRGGSAADLVLKNGISYKDALVSCYTRNAQGAGVLNVRLLSEETQEYSEEYALPVAEVQQLSFVADEPLGTLANIVVAAGQAYPPMQVTQAENHPTHGFVFHVVDENSSPENPLKVPASQLFSVTFPNQTPPSSNSDYGSSSGEYGSGSYSSGSDDDSTSYRGSSFDEEEEEESGLGGGGLMLFAGIGLAVIGLALLIFLVLNTLVNSGLILIICKMGSVPEIRYKQCFFCALYLGILPIILLPLLLIPFFGLWAFLLCLMAGARAIVMGSLEVLEGPAWGIIAAFLVSSWLLRRFIGEFAGMGG